MLCLTCGQSFDTQTNGFVICPYCGTVNMADQPAIQTPAQLSNTSQVPEFKTKRHFHFSKRWIIGLTLITTLCSLTLTGGFLWYEDQHAQAYLNTAKTDITHGKYADADAELARASKLFTIGHTHRQIYQLQKQNQIWQSDAHKIEQANQLIAQGKLSDASKILAQIDAAFPGYDQVTKLQKTIKDQLALLAQKPVVVPVTIPTKKTPTNNTPPQITINTSIGKRFTSTSAETALTNATTIAQATQALQSFGSQYNLDMEVTTVTPSSYVTSYATYSTLAASDLPNLKTYGNLFIDEWSKYPTDWVTNSQLKHIVLIKNFAVQGTHRAAGPDPIGKAMYYDVSFSGDYAREVVHHEYDHLITYDYFGSYAPSDPTWSSFNPPNFHYGNGGASCYTPGNCLTGEHPILGFVTGYSTSAIEEDKAETYAYLMTDTYYHHLNGWLPSDPYLTSKVNYYKQFIASYSPEMAGSYFSDINP